MGYWRYYPGKKVGRTILSDSPGLSDRIVRPTGGFLCRGKERPRNKFPLPALPLTRGSRRGFSLGPRQVPAGTPLHPPLVRGEARQPDFGSLFRGRSIPRQESRSDNPVRLPRPVGQDCPTYRRIFFAGVSDLCRRRGRDPPAEVPELPPPRAGRAVRADDVQGRDAVGGLPLRGGRRSPHAPLACRPALRPLRQRPPPDPERAGHAAGLGRAGNAPGRPRAGAARTVFSRGLVHRHARSGLQDPRALHGQGERVSGLSVLRRAHPFLGRCLGPGRRGPAGRTLGRAPHRRVPDRSEVPRLRRASVRV